MGLSILDARQRSSIRRAARVDCEVVAEHGFRLLGRRVVDLSEDGLRILAEDGARIGEDVVFAFRIPGGSSWVDGEARVTRLVHGRRPGDPGPCIGLRFTAMDRVSRAMLNGSLAGLPPPAPERSVRRDYASTVFLISLS